MDVGTNKSIWENKQSVVMHEWIFKELKDKPIIWSAFILFVIMVVIIWFCYCLKLFRSLSATRANAYKNLVKSGFFKRWIIRDLYGITYNPSRLEDQSSEITL